MNDLHRIVSIGQFSEECSLIHSVCHSFLTGPSWYEKKNIQPLEVDKICSILPEFPELFRFRTETNMCPWIPNIIQAVMEKGWLEK